MTEEQLLEAISPEGIKIGFEDLLSCQAACAGCTLTHEERTRGGLWAERNEEAAGSVAKREIDAKAAIPGVREADLIGVQLFQGNHLLLSEDDIGRLVHYLAGIAGNQSDVILSTSPVGKPRLIERGLKALSRARDETGLSIDTALVLSDEREYRNEVAKGIDDNIRAIREHFDLTDAVLPIPPDTGALADPVAFHRRIEEQGFETLALALQPTLANAAQFRESWPFVIGWIRKLLKTWNERGGYDLMLYKNAGRTIGYARNLPRELVPLALSRRLRRQIFIDHHGFAYFMQEGIGGDDMPLSGRYGFRPTGHATDSDLDRNLDRAADETARRIWRGYLSDSKCASCPHISACALSGGGQIKQSLRGAATTDACPIGISELMDDLDEIVTERLT